MAIDIQIDVQYSPTIVSSIIKPREMYHPVPIQSVANRATLTGNADDYTTVTRVPESGVRGMLKSASERIHSMKR